ncbi:MAG: UDP-N-acetylglucosamine 1-carboxyvinyltransferase [Sumerlaeia bacterium]
MDLYVIRGKKPLQGTVHISGSKNACLPLMCAALLGDTPTILDNVPDLQDVRSMKLLLEHLNVKVAYKDNRMVIDPSNFDTDWVPYDMMRKMRASMYAFGPMISKRRKASVSKPGGCNIGSRPIDLHLKGFRALGVEMAERHGYIHARHDGMVGKDFSLKGKNGPSVGATCNVLMAASLAKGETVIRDAAREPEVQELANFLNAMGAQITGIGTCTLTILGVESLRGTTWHVQPDRIEAATFAVAALITEGDLLLKNVRPSEMTATLELLKAWGADIHQPDPTTLRVRVDENRTPTPQMITTAPYPELATDVQPLFCTLLAVTPGVSRVQETIYQDRFMHIEELNRLGAQIEQIESGVEITGMKTLTAAPVMASDLRAGAALTLAALAAEGESTVRRIYHVERGYERFEQKLAAVGADIRRLQENTVEAPKPIDWESITGEQIISEIDTHG